MKKFQLLAAALASVCMLSPLPAQTRSDTDTDPLTNVSAQTSIYLITFAEPGLLYNTGQNRSFVATAPSSTGERKLNARSSASVAYLSYLKGQQDDYLAQISSKIGRFVAPAHRYDITENGMAIALTEVEAALVSKIAGVTRIRADEVFEMNTDAGPAWIGAPGIWTGTTTPTASGSRGQGVLVGVMDSGGNSDHPSFANDPSCGFSAANPKIVATKDCNTANCATGNGEDVSINVDANNPGSGGHGVHTASTSVGGAIAAGTLVGGVAARFNISGVAPCAKVITYKICGDTLPTGFGSCNGSAIQAGIQTAIVDQVDVVNFSVSGGTNPWSDNDRGFLDMLNADILVSASAGNTRAAPNNIPVGAVNHRGPWVMTVASSTHNRGETPGVVNVPGSLQNVAGVGSSGPQWPATALVLPVAVGSVLGSELGCGTTSPYPAGSMTGKIALISRGTCPFAEKVTNATSAGATAVVMYNNAAGAAIVMGGLGLSTIPSMMITQPDGIAIRDFLTANPAVTMSALGPQRLIDSVLADILSDFSLRGPNIIGVTTVGTNTYNGTDTTKPDITGPGSNIYAALSDNFGQFGFLSGTSMSAPHLAGSAALIRSVQPSWTPTEVKSALMLTAFTEGRKSDGVTAWDLDDIGNGRVDLTRASKVGLVMNETFANFVAANPAVSGNQQLVRQLNTPSLRNTQMVGSYAFTRTFRNASGMPRTWSAVTTGAPAGTTVSVVPATFDFGTDTSQTQTVVITVTLTQALPALSFGAVSFVPSDGQPSVGDIIFQGGFEGFDPLSARMTIAVQGTL